MPALDIAAMRVSSQNVDTLVGVGARSARRLSRKASGRGLRRWRSVDSELRESRRLANLEKAQAAKEARQLAAMTPDQRITAQQRNADRAAVPLLYPPPGARDPLSAQNIELLSPDEQRAAYEQKISIQTTWVAQMDDHLEQLRAQCSAANEKAAREKATRAKEHQRLMDAAVERERKREAAVFAKAKRSIERPQQLQIGGGSIYPRSTLSSPGIRDSNSWSKTLSPLGLAPAALCRAEPVLELTSPVSNAVYINTKRQAPGKRSVLCDRDDSLLADALRADAARSSAPSPLTEAELSFVVSPHGHRGFRSPSPMIA